MAAWPPLATWGEWLERFEQLAPRVLRAPGHVLRVLADLRPMAAVGPGRAPRGPRRVVGAAAAGGRPPADAALRPAVRRQPGAGERPHVPRGVRPRRRRTRLSAEGASGRAAARCDPGPAERAAPHQGRSERPRPDAAPSGRRRGQRAAVPVVSAPRRRRVARARALVLRARCRPRRHGPDPRSRGAGDGSVRGRGRDVGLAGTLRCRRRDRRPGARPRRAARPAGHRAG